jgi:hypothetical protein
VLLCAVGSVNFLHARVEVYWLTGFNDGVIHAFASERIEITDEQRDLINGFQRYGAVTGEGVLLASV